MSRANEPEATRLADLLGRDLVLHDPLVYHAMSAVRHGVNTTEQALVRLVHALVMERDAARDLALELTREARP